MYNLIRFHSYPNASRQTRVSDLRKQLDQLFEQSPAELDRSNWTPALDVFQNDEAIVVLAELPGFKKEDFAITLHDGVLTLSGERKASENPGEVVRQERATGQFNRTLSLPVAVDGAKVSAAYQDGVLSVTLPKAEEAKPRQIAVNVA